MAAIVCDILESIRTNPNFKAIVVATMDLNNARCGDERDDIKPALCRMESSNT